MEKKGDILNQLAIISDLIEKVNVNTVGKVLILELEKEEFEKTFKIVQQKYNRKIITPNNSFTVTIGEVDIIFKMIKNLV